MTSVLNVDTIADKAGTGPVALTKQSAAKVFVKLSGASQTISKSFKNGINVIDPKKYRILGGHGYYFPTWNIAKQLIDIVEKKKKMRALDTEMVYLQRKGIIKYNKIR